MIFNMAHNLIRYSLSKNTSIFNRFYHISVRSMVTSFFNWEPKEKETHTGQVEENFFIARLSRFMDKSKQVNPNWAVKLVAEVPPIPVKSRVACCDGGSGPTGHPKVYINLDKPGNQSCLYCGLRFYREECH